MKKIYIAGSYSSKNYYGIKENIKRAERAYINLLVRGWNPFCPHKLSPENYEIYTDVINNAYNIGYNEWLQITFDWLKICDAIYMLRNWEKSIGASQEHNYALLNNLEAYYEENGIPNLRGEYEFI